MSWDPPPYDWWKLNPYGSSLGNPGQAGGLIRDTNGMELEKGFIGFFFLDWFSLFWFLDPVSCPAHLPNPIDSRTIRPSFHSFLFLRFPLGLLSPMVTNLTSDSTIVGDDSIRY